MTPSADRILECIARTVAERGYPPRPRDRRRGRPGVDLRRPSSPDALERDGLLERGPHSLARPAPHVRARGASSVRPRRDPASAAVTPFRMPVERDVSPLPVLGEIAAGQPIEAYEDARRVAGRPRSLEARDDSYVLRVRGKSMIDALIDDGDYVIVQPQATARDGDIVVALLEDNGVTLKRFFREKDRIRLQPANAEMEPIYATEVQIQGKVVGVIRKLALSRRPTADGTWRRAPSCTPTWTRSMPASRCSTTRACVASRSSSAATAATAAW